MNKVPSPRTPLLVITPCNRVLSLTIVYHDTSEYVDDSSWVRTEEVAPISYLTQTMDKRTKIQNTSVRACGTAERSSSSGESKKNTPTHGQFQRLYWMERLHGHRKPDESAPPNSACSPRYNVYGAQGPQKHYKLKNTTNLKAKKPLNCIMQSILQRQHPEATSKAHNP